MNAASRSPSRARLLRRSIPCQSWRSTTSNHDPHAGALRNSLVSNPASTNTPSWNEADGPAGASSRLHYLQTRPRTIRIWSLFQQVTTPIEEDQQAADSSRPGARKSGPRNLSSLRAIAPGCFADPEPLSVCRVWFGGGAAPAKEELDSDPGQLEFCGPALTSAGASSGC